MSGFSLSATALTDLVLTLETAIEPSIEMTLLASLREMHCLCNLGVSITGEPLDHPSQHSVPKDTVTMPELTRFRYIGQNTFLNNLMAGISAPSIQNVCFYLLNSLPILHIPRFIDGLREPRCTVNATFNGHGEDNFRLSLLTHSRDIDHFKPSFLFHTNRVPSQSNQLLVAACPLQSLPLQKYSLSFSVIRPRYQNCGIVFPCANSSDSSAALRCCAWIHSSQRLHFPSSKMTEGPCYPFSGYLYPQSCGRQMVQW